MRTPELSKVLVEDRGKRWKKLWNIEESLNMQRRAAGSRSGIEGIIFSKSGKLGKANRTVKSS